ncbi:MAG: Mur ligase family protein [Marinisporobacter sp.]|jgi:UDP-N-acetylmuramoyl-L-alanyl-D-glutamate--2,6-diaminopimelate ligase|nr:Mur ligase family protein [Marinisporobacter sp.]
MLFEEMKKIGIAGTNGKTTTAKMIYHVLREQGVYVGFISKEEISTNGEKLETDFSHLNIENIFYLSDEMTKKNVEIIIMEIDHSFFDKKVLQGMDFDMIVYTSIEMDDIKNIDETKKYMDLQKDILSNLSHKGILIINTDDKNSFKLLENIKNRLIITYGFSSKATITASSIEIAPIEFNCCIQRGITSLNNIDLEPMEVPIAMNFIGKHNVYNALAAITAVLILGISPENVRNALKELKKIKRRMYKIQDNEYQIIDDRCENPASFEVVFEAVQSVDYKKLTIVNSIIGNKGIELNKRNARIIANWIKGLKSAKLITTCSIDVVEDEDQVSEDEKKGFYEVLREDEIVYEHKERLEDALNSALSHAGRKDLILLLGGRGMDQGENLIKKLLKEKK